jgi:chromosome segregation ATPase
LLACIYTSVRATRNAQDATRNTSIPAEIPIPRPADTATTKLPSGLFGRIQDKVSGIDQRLTQQTEKYLKKMARREARIQKKLSGIDSAAAGNLFSNSSAQYAALLKKIKTDSSGKTALKGEYQPYTDSLQTSLAFLQQNPQLLSNTGGKTPQQLQSQLQNATGELQQLQTRLGNADEIETYVSQRKQQIKECLSRYTNLPAGLSKEYQGLTQDMYYYRQQVQQYKQLLNDPDKMEKKALGLLSQTPAFQDFMKTHSQLAGLFGLPGNASNVNPSTMAALTGLQTRDQLQQTI